MLRINGCRALHREGFFVHHFQFQLDIPEAIPSDSASLLEQQEHLREHALMQIALPVSTIAADIEISLPKRAPTLELLDNKTFCFNASDLLIRFTIDTKDKPTTELRLNLQLEVYFRLEVEEKNVDGLGLRVDRMQLDLSDESDPSTGHPYTADTMNHMMLATTATQMWLRRLERALNTLWTTPVHTMVPVPIRLPWPFSEIKIRDFGFHALLHLWEMEAELELEGSTV